MNNNINLLKIATDVIMTVLFLCMMAYHITGNKLHEWLGIILFALFILHHILNIKWYKGIFKGKYSAVRILSTILNFSLFAAMIGMMISDVMLSREVFGFLNLRAGMFGRRLHMISTAWGYILISAHLGMHWGMVIGRINKKIRTHKRAIETMSRILVLMTAIYGIYALNARQIADRLFLLIEYAFFDFQEPALFFFADYIAVLVLFASITYYLSKIMKIKKGGKK
ncbi:MAG: DUF4405 domain-containing protein [Ruminococcus flavefaciens]|nr:DUF4405 domain-containing protein [Ruminococcus flavefaciens]MCM1060972.1 DUF4405 domain-containing protein [Eubacterium sp.]